MLTDNMRDLGNGLEEILLLEQQIEAKEQQLKQAKAELCNQLYTELKVRK